MTKQAICILSGAGISAESGVPTYRSGMGLWNGLGLEQLANPATWQADPDTVSHSAADNRHKKRNVGGRVTGSKGWNPLM